ncbi:hypothetical protein SO802_011356 [Lithocarpus litseifolius]|uniref:Uncharacterized protein n=1 Tax=Lithocarpus litseifolius TaxID=425828 RepID=A0AAW2CZR6_9ROSI
MSYSSVSQLEIPSQGMIPSQSCLPARGRPFAIANTMIMTSSDNTNKCIEICWCCPSLNTSTLMSPLVRENFSNCLYCLKFRQQKQQQPERQQQLYSHHDNRRLFDSKGREIIAQAKSTITVVASNALKT